MMSKKYYFLLILLVPVFIGGCWWTDEDLFVNNIYDVNGTSFFDSCYPNAVSVYYSNGSTLCANVSGSTGGVTGSGSARYLAIWSNASHLIYSNIFEDKFNIVIENKDVFISKNLTVNDSIIFNDGTSMNTAISSSGSSNVSSIASSYNVPYMVNNTLINDSTITFKPNLGFGNVGINRDSPSYRLDVWGDMGELYAGRFLLSSNVTGMSALYASATSNLNNSGFTPSAIQARMTVASGTNREAIGLYGGVYTQDTNYNYTQTIQGLRFTAQHSGSGVLNQASGLVAFPYVSKGIITNAYAGYFYTWTAGGNMTNAYNVFIRSPTITGNTSTISNLYGLYIEKLKTASNVTNSYGIYQTDSADQNYLGGKLMLGSLNGTYTGGSAHVCVYNNGTLFSSESACP